MQNRPKVSSPDPLFQRNRETLFWPIPSLHVYKMSCQHCTSHLHIWNEKKKQRGCFFANKKKWVKQRRRSLLQESLLPSFLQQRWQTASATSGGYAPFLFSETYEDLQQVRTQMIKGWEKWRRSLKWMGVNPNVEGRPKWGTHNCKIQNFLPLGEKSTWNSNLNFEARKGRKFRCLGGQGNKGRKKERKKTKKKINFSKRRWCPKSTSHVGTSQSHICKRKYESHSQGFLKSMWAHARRAATNKEFQV